MNQITITVPGRAISRMLLIATAILLPLFVWSDFFFADFMCRYVCTGKNSGLAATTIAADLAIMIAYFGIPFSIAIALRRVSNLQMKGGGGIATLFILFIFFCGLTHGLQALAWYRAWYNLIAWVSVVTAVTSLLTLWRLAYFVTRLIAEQAAAMAAKDEQIKEMQAVIEKYQLRRD